jgi:hypothetical protein
VNVVRDGAGGGERFPVGRRSPGQFEVGFVTEEGISRCVMLAEAQALPFERFRPVRRFAARKGQRHLSGLWWSATTGGNVGFESWLERDIYWPWTSIRR